MLLTSTVVKLVLPDLLVDPYQFPASQIQAEYFAANEAHMFKYQANENVAWGFTPQEAAAFWYSEKIFINKWRPNMVCLQMKLS